MKPIQGTFPMIHNDTLPLDHTPRVIKIEQKWLGRCVTCKHMYRADNCNQQSCNYCSRVYFLRSLSTGALYTCGHAGSIQWSRIKGTFSDHKCDVRCTHAIRHVCNCSCGGANHGSAWG